MKTLFVKSTEVDAKWHLVDAEGKILGRLATKLARILMGKHKPSYTPNVDTGDFLVVVNADKVRFTGKKLTQKEYDWYTYYPSGRRVCTLEEMLAKHPTEPLRLAVKRMLPKTKLGRKMLTKLRLFAGPEHTHHAQQPVPLEL